MSAYQNAMTLAWAMSDDELYARTVLRDGHLREGLQRLVWAASKRPPTEARALRLEAASIGLAALSSLGMQTQSGAEDTQESPACWSFLVDAARRANDRVLSNESPELHVELGKQDPPSSPSAGSVSVGGQALAERATKSAASFRLVTTESPSN